MRVSIINIILLCLAPIVLCDDLAPAKLIVVKEVENDVIAQGMDLTIKYTLCNVGEKPATDVELADSSFPESDFQFVAGLFNVQWPKINPGGNVTHVVVVRPLKNGDYNFTSAMVQYVASESSEPTFGFSSDAGELPILSDKEYERIYADHFVFQRRKYGNVSFYRGWDDYVNGFGDNKGDFWLGLETMHEMTKEGNMEMKIKMITREGVYWAVEYRSFRIGPGSDNYRLHVSGYSGNATYDCLARHNNRQFSTKDADHENSPRDCASDHEGGWWYERNVCAWSNLNGNFNEQGINGFWWNDDLDGDGLWDVRRFLRFSEMKLRKRL